jgi:LmbE family N-acetylglucosaminyl deacetylase
MLFRPMARVVKRMLARIIESIWRLGFDITFLLTRHGTNPWSSPGDQRILVVAPHPDDEVMGCVGTILLHIQSRDSVCVAIATDGRRSTVIPDPAEMAIQRQREATDAARIMQIDRLEWIGLPEGEWTAKSLADKLIALIDEIKPNIVYAPSRIDFHPEHLKVAHALALALDEVEASQRCKPLVRIYQVQVPLTRVMANLVADVSALVPECETVMRTYASQAGSLQCTYRLRRYCARANGIVEQAEEFWEMAAAKYCALHRALPVNRPETFRGLRNFPLTDPLAFFVGAKERRKLR